jgi:hypothetical protein
VIKVSADRQDPELAWEFVTRALDLADRMVKRAERLDSRAGDRAVFTSARLAFALFDRATAIEADHEETRR